jgi:O-antigen biosynthesis protein WbqP
MAKRFVDLCIVIIATSVFLLPFLFIMLAIKMSSPGPIFYWSRRIGKNSKPFMMPKFRTMYVDTPEVATDLLQAPCQHITPLGSFLRRTSLDELPQLISVFSGYMSIVGPRPALHSQIELITARQNMGIDRITPGITGWAQINGRDEIDLATKLELDNEYLQTRSVAFDIKIIFLSVAVVFTSRGVKH